jgi:REP element-mobilizing transposase RayT
LGLVADVPRQPRIELAGGIHHVWQRGNNRRTIFMDAGDRQLFLRLLAATARKHDWQCLSYCLLDNHFHLVVETPTENLGHGMRDLCSQYAQLFNERHETGGGHLFQARFGSKVVRTDEQLAQLFRYVAHNPVGAGLCSDPAEWPWSSHAAALAGRRRLLVRVDRIESLLGGFVPTRGNAYAALFERDGPLEHLQPDVSPWEMRPTLPELLAVPDLAAAVRRARRHGYRVADVAAHLGVSEVTLWRRLKETGSVPL